jgi:hypothetical protein
VEPVHVTARRCPAAVTAVPVQVLELAVHASDVLMTTAGTVPGTGGTGCAWA